MENKVAFSPAGYEDISLDIVTNTSDYIKKCRLNAKEHSLSKDIMSIMYLNDWFLPWDMITPEFAEVQTTITNEIIEIIEDIDGKTK